MSTFPPAIAGYLQQLTLETHTPAYLSVDSDGALCTWGGALAAYGLEHLRAAVAVDEQVPLLAGLLPLDTPSLCLPAVVTTTGRYADVHLFATETGYEVLLLDVTADMTRYGHLQQRVNTFNLLLEKLAGLSASTLAPTPSENPVSVLQEVVMHASLFVDIFTSMDIVVLERLPDGAFRVIGNAPLWFHNFFPDFAVVQQRFFPATMFPFLENFLVDAEYFWLGNQTGILKSGAWQETDTAGRLHHLEASALCVDESNLLVITFPKMEYAEKQAIIQRARENSLERYRLGKEVQNKEILLHCIIHDLAGPLTSIMFSLSILESEVLSATAKKSLELSKMQAYKQQLLIRQLLDIFSAEVRSLEAFTFDPAQAPDILECAEEVVEALHPACVSKHLSLYVDPQVTRTVPWSVVGERSRLERILFNLIENAVRHSPPMGKVQLNMEMTDTEILVTVNDEGPGVSPEVVETLFEKFSQAQAHTGKAGLGLYFCKITVERWGGTIGYLPRPSGGAQFWFRLPRPTSPAS